MEVYLVGGAVRDELLGYPHAERDWVVVGATPEQLLAQGFRQVGRDFPVFLHPHSDEEYALARTERKQGHGYTGFVVHYDPDVTLEEDLARRDLTINAMARSASGEIIDPYGGRADLERRVLRHVSDAFVEDPLRVLRVARFAARYHHLGFTVAQETRALMAEIVAQGELAHLTRERVWVELERALGERSPAEFIRVLRACGALAALLPEVEALFGVPQVALHHPEIDTGVHTLMGLEQAAALTTATTVRFAVLLHDLGKGTTPRERWPRHIGHERRGRKLVTAVCERLAAPKAHTRLALLACQYHTHCHRALELRGKTLMKLLQAADALRRPGQFEELILACEADARGRAGLETREYPQADHLRHALATVQAISAATLAESGLDGKALGDALYRARVAALEELRRG
jgi:tRNA nucleotidyltransferase (CCA-adding enzyme)